MDSLQMVYFADHATADGFSKDATDIGQSRYEVRCPVDRAVKMIVDRLNFPIASIGLGRGPLQRVIQGPSTEDTVGLFRTLGGRFVGPTLTIGVGTFGCMKLFSWLSAPGQ